MKHTIRIALMFGFLLAAGLGAAGAEGGTGAAGNPTPAELAEFFDAVVPALMQEHHLVGAVVGVADRSEVLLLRGYGQADLETGRAVDPRVTLFQAGSISKLFTWTAIMQLEEQGLLRLEDPVQMYLDFRLPETFAQPIRIVDLMNHTPGFEDRLIGLMVQDYSHHLSLREALTRRVPRRVRPPGQEVSYSNYGAMLAGYVVERLSGMPYEDYVEAKIFQPLGMSRSSFRQPLPPQLAADMARPYAYGDGRQVVHRQVLQKPEILNGAPAGALCTTAPDLLRFYQAFLNGGQLGGRRILREQTVRRMQQPSFRHDQRAAGLAHGFFEIMRGDLRALGHSGDTIYFHSDSAYLPDQGLAYFVSTNSAAGMQLTMKLREEFLARFFPTPTGEELAAASPPDLRPAEGRDLRQYTGVFAMNRRSESDPTQILGALAMVRPKLAQDGTRLWIATILDPAGSLYVRVAPDIFQQADGFQRIVFLRDGHGRVRSLYSHEFPAFLFNRPPWFEHPAASLVAVGLGLLLLLLAAIAPPTGLLCLVPRLRPRGAGAGRALALWSARAYLLLVLAQVALVASLGNILFVPMGPMHALPLYLAAAAAAVVLAALVPVWRQRLFRPLGRVHYSAFAVSQALLLVWLGHWGFFFV